MSDEDCARQYQLIGETIIIRALSNVNYILTTNQNYIKKERRRKCLGDLNFINNGGIDSIVDFFQLDLDADTLYQTFYYKMKHR